MTDENMTVQQQVRLEALRLANTAQMGGNAMLNHTSGPAADYVVARADKYANFILRGETS